MNQKLPNDPTLFIDSVTDKKQGEENQTSFDSRAQRKPNLTKNRLDDIYAMLLYKINILCEIKTKTTLYEGVVSNVDDNYLYLVIDKKTYSIDINEIENINILRL